jgi:fructose-bisphosphate aldolase class II
MALVSAKEMLNKARAGKYAVGQFNINNLEWTKAILQTAQELQSPVILGVSEGAGKYMAGYKTVVGMVKGMIEELNITVPVALHLDHGSFEGAKACINAGFSSIMFDGSHLPFEENVAKTDEEIKAEAAEAEEAAAEEPAAPSLIDQIQNMTAEQIAELRAKLDEMAAAAEEKAE